MNVPAAPRNRPPRGPRDPGELPTGTEKTELVRTMFDTISPRYDLVNRIMTFGLDTGWRRKACRLLALPPGSTVLDVACGTGDFQHMLAARGYLTLGVDLSWGMLSENRSDRPLAQCDASALPFASKMVDGITCGYALRNFTDLARSFAEFSRVLRPGGRLSIVEVAEPTNPVLKLGHRIWFKGAVPRIGALLSDGAAYRYLPRSTAYLPPTDELRTMLNRHGFSGVNHHLLLGGLSQVITATRGGNATSEHRSETGRAR